MSAGGPRALDPHLLYRSFGPECCSQTIEPGLCHFAEEIFAMRSQGEC